jgi:hypothetical protein
MQSIYTHTYMHTYIHTDYSDAGVHTHTHTHMHTYMRTHTVILFEDKDANDESMAADAGVRLHSLSELREAGGRQVATCVLYVVCVCVSVCLSLVLSLSFTHTLSD